MTYLVLNLTDRIISAEAQTFSQASDVARNLADKDMLRDVYAVAELKRTYVVERRVKEEGVYPNLSDEGARPSEKSDHATPGMAADQGQGVSNSLEKSHTPGLDCPACRDSIPLGKTRPELLRLLEEAKNHVMTDDEIKAQRESWARQDMD